MSLPSKTFREEVQSIQNIHQDIFSYLLQILDIDPFWIVTKEKSECIVVCKIIFRKSTDIFKSCLCTLTSGLIMLNVVECKKNRLHAFFCGIHPLVVVCHSYTTGLWHLQKVCDSCHTDRYHYLLAQWLTTKVTCTSGCTFAVTKGFMERLCRSWVWKNKYIQKSRRKIKKVSHWPLLQP